MDKKGHFYCYVCKKLFSSDFKVFYRGWQTKRRQISVCLSCYSKLRMQININTFGSCRAHTFGMQSSMVNYLKPNQLKHTYGVSVWKIKMKRQKEKCL